MSGCNYLGAVFLSGNWPGVIVWGAVVLGENCPVGIARGGCLKQQFSGGQLFGGRGANCPGGNCPVSEIKSIFHYFYRAFSCQKFSQT